MPPTPESDPAIVRMIRQWKADLLAEEAEQMRLMARRWIEIENTLEAQITALSYELSAMKTVPAWKLVQLERYKALLAQAQFETDKYVKYAEDLISSRKLELGRLGADHALETLSELRGRAVRIRAAWDRLPTDAINAMIGYAKDGSPLAELLRPVYADAVTGLTQAIVDGLALGLNPREIARNMRNGFGMGLNRSMLVARTEQLRAYRTANQWQYQRSNVVSGYRRLATHDSRVCAGCLFSEGEHFDLETDFEEHPQGRCTLVPEVVGASLNFVDGKQWFERQSASDQLKFLGAERYELYKSGTPLSAFVQHNVDPVWGGSFTPTPLKVLKAGS